MQKPPSRFRPSCREYWFSRVRWPLVSSGISKATRILFSLVSTRCCFSEKKIADILTSKILFLQYKNNHFQNIYISFSKSQTQFPSTAPLPIPQPLPIHSYQISSPNVYIISPTKRLSPKHLNNLSLFVCFTCPPKKSTFSGPLADPLAFFLCVSFLHPVL